MNTKTIVAMSLAAILSFATTSAFADPPSFLTVKEAEVDEGEVEIETKGKIPTDGTGGAFGYGVVGTSGILVFTTHGGVGPDSSVQTGQGDPVFHTHGATVGFVAACDGPGVTSITDEPTIPVEVKKKKLEAENYNGQVGDLSNTILSFTLSVVGDPASPTAVCVNNIQSFTAED